MVKYNKSNILWLFNHGYRQKLIQLILDYPQSTVSKTINNSKNILPVLSLTPEQEVRKYVIDRILELRSLPTNGYTDYDKQYIKLLDYLLVDQDKIRKLYYNISQYRITNALRNSKLDMLDFMPQFLELEDDEWRYFAEVVRKFRSSKN